jgi:hypothetical protein
VCEAYYYSGEACLLSGRINEALTYLQKCVQTDLVFDPDAIELNPMSEYHLAHWRPRQLGDRGGTTSRRSGEEVGGWF